jgi:hypothetical protein
MIPAPRPDPGVVADERRTVIWRTVYELVSRADEAGVLANQLGAVASLALREQGRPVPAVFEREARFARAAWMGSIPLLGRIRSLCDGPLLLIKGPEVAALYPGHARAFVDIDLLCPNAEAVHAALRANGFIEVDDPEIYEQEQHHLRPLQWPALWLKIEIHTRPWWPEGLNPPDMAEIVAKAVPSATGVPGICAPHPAHHAMILASHSWQAQPLETLRGLVDVAAVANRVSERELTAAARAWGIERIWRTTYEAATGLLADRRRTAPVRLWARHLPAVEERSVIGNHLQRWLHGFWGFPPRLALQRAAVGLRKDLLRYPNETWREKFIRLASALTRPRAPMSSHTRAWRERVADDPPEPPRQGT